LRKGEELPPFTLEVRGEVEDFLSGSYRFTSMVETNIAFSESTPDLGLVPISWMDKYVTDPVNKFLKDIPFVGGLFGSTNNSEILKGSGGDSGEIKEEVMNIIRGVSIGNGEDKDKKKETAESEKKKNKSADEEKIKKEKEKADKKQKKEEQEKQKKEEKERKAEEKIIQKEEEKRKKDIEKVKKALEKKLEEEEKEKVKKEQEEKKLAEKLEKEEEKRQEKQEREEEKQEKEEKEEFYAKKCARESSAQIKRESIIFNEFAWMGSKENSSYEWIELKNIGNQAVNLDGWKIYGKDADEDFVFKKELLVNPGEYVLLEKSEKSVPWVDADFIFKGSLNNSNEKYYLYDADCNFHDSVNADPDWPAGSNEEKRTMENAGDFSWHTYSGSSNNGIFGTPKQENSRYENNTEERVRMARFPNLYASSKPSHSSSSGVHTSVPQVDYCSASTLEPTHTPIIINEIAWMGTVASSSNEWIELKNITENEVSLSGWQLFDKNKDIKVVFGEDEKITANGFYLLERTDDNSVSNVAADKIYSGALSDKSESLILFNRSCELIDYVAAEDSWTEGNSKDKQSMERENDLSWHTYAGDADSVSGLYGTPKQENSIGTKNQENENNEEEEEEEDEDIEDQKIDNLLVRMGNLKNQVVLEWSGQEDIEYIVYYRVGGIDEETFSNVADYFSVDFGFETGINKAIISDLYFDKNYFFEVGIKKDEGFLPLSDVVSIQIDKSEPILAFKHTDYSRTFSYDFTGPADYENKQLSDFSEMEMEFSSYPIIDANRNFYLIGKEKEGVTLNSFYPNGDLKWKFNNRQGTDPIIGSDGTIYFNNSEYVFALSPAGKVKWKQKFSGIYSNDPAIDKNGNIFILASDEPYKMSLFLVKEAGKEIIREKLVSSEDLWGDVSFGFHSEITMDDLGNLYFAASNILIKYNIQTKNFEKRVIPADCSRYYADKCATFRPGIISIVASGSNLYASFNNAYIGEVVNLNRVFAFDINNFLGDYLWMANNSMVAAARTDSVYVYQANATVFMEKSRIVALNPSSGVEEWTKEWNRLLDERFFFVDSKKIVYVIMDNDLVGYDTTLSPNEDEVFRVNLQGNENVSIYSEGMFAIRKDAKIMRR